MSGGKKDGNKVVE